MGKLSPTTKYLLESFIPYTEANFTLAFKPRRFFYELEKKSKLNAKSISSAYYRAIARGLIVVEDGLPRLTDKGKAGIVKYKATRLGEHARLLVIFDIPEQYRQKRDHLRGLLKELGFVMIQQSVWESKYDFRDYIQMEVEEYSLQDYVAVYEASKLSK